MNKVINMVINKGFTLIEVLIALLILAILVALAGVFWGWNTSAVQEQAYVRALEELLSRTKRSAEIREQQIAICFSLSDKCAAEGVLVPKGNAGWQLLEGLPLNDDIFLRTNLRNQQLIIQPGGQSVRQPGTLYICSVHRNVSYVWSLVIARSGRVTKKKIQGRNVDNICGNIER